MRSSFQPTAWIAADIVRVVDGVLVERWDVIDNDASRDASKSGHPCSAVDGVTPTCRESKTAARYSQPDVGNSSERARYRSQS